MADRIEHVLIPYKDKQVHLEVQAAGDGAPTVVFSPGIGGYARFYLPVLGKLCDEGFNVVGIDRPGHGLSEGRRGDCTIEQILDVVEDAVRYSRERFGGPVVLMGSSLGGIITWYSLTREPDVEAAVCHNIAHPSVFHEPSVRPKAAALKRLRRVAPYAGVPIKQIADFGEVAQSPEVLDYFRREPDRIWCWKISARSAASLFEYEPPVAWSQVTTPALVLVGSADEMVSPDFTRQVIDASAPPNCELRVLPGMGHMLFLDHLDEALPVVVDWMRQTSSRARQRSRWAPERRTMRSRFTAATFLTTLLLAGCGGDVDKDKAQDQIAKGIESQAKADVKYVKCPGGVKAEKGATFQCEALIPVNVTQIDENGNIRWQITSFTGPPAGTTGTTGTTGATGATGLPVFHAPEARPAGRVQPAPTTRGSRSTRTGPRATRLSTRFSGSGWARGATSTSRSRTDRGSSTLSSRTARACRRLRRRERLSTTSSGLRGRSRR